MSLPVRVRPAPQNTVGIKRDSRKMHPYFLTIKIETMSNLKKIIRKYMQRKETPPLIHLIINVRSHGNSKWVSKKIKEIINNTALDREHGIKNEFINQFHGSCFIPFIPRYQTGGKTWEKNGKYYSHNPEYPDGLPF